MNASRCSQGVEGPRRRGAHRHHRAITERPGVVGGEQLHGAATATTVRVSDGISVTSGSPFADTEEFFGGFYMLQADDLDAAIGLAWRIPAARMGGSIEIRPVVER